MIRFSCHCGHQFILDDSEAAGTVQCPNCRKLNDVPTHHDLLHMGEDGSLEIKPLEIEEEPERLALLSQIYAKGRKDEFGNDIDFRPTPEDLAARGVPAPDEPPQIIRPRYDPETGQLIRPIDVKAAPPHKPVPRVMNAPRREIPPPAVLSAKDLAKLVNVFVMLCAMLFMLLAGLFAILVFLPNLHFFMFAAPMAFFEILVIAHYGATIEELGPRARDELPRIFGEVQFYEDFGAPLGAISLALLICYAPAIICFNLPVPTLALVLGLLAAGFGTYLFPAVILTLTTSGTLSNLRPDRLFGTISACGSSYIWPIVSWMFAGGIYFWALLRFVAPLVGHAEPYLVMLPATMTMLAAIPFVHVLTVPFAHVFAWQTGMLYRRYYEAFPWVGQRHEKKIAAAKV